MQIVITAEIIGSGRITDWDVALYVASGVHVKEFPALVPNNRQFAVAFIFETVWDAGEFCRFSKTLLRSGARAFGFAGVMCNAAEDIVDENRIDIEVDEGGISIPTLTFRSESLEESLQTLLGVYISNCEGAAVAPALIVFHVGTRDSFASLLNQLNMI